MMAKCFTLLRNWIWQIKIYILQNLHQTYITLLSGLHGERIVFVSYHSRWKGWNFFIRFYRNENVLARNLGLNLLSVLFHSTWSWSDFWKYFNIDLNVKLIFRFYFQLFISNICMAVWICLHKIQTLTYLKKINKCNFV